MAERSVGVRMVEGIGIGDCDSPMVMDIGYEALTAANGKVADFTDFYVGLTIGGQLVNLR